MSSSTSAAVLLSGGLDSATVLAIARSEGLACHCLTVDYGQRHRVELEAAARVAKHLGAASPRVVALDLLSAVAVGIMAAWSVAADDAVYLDVALLVALLAFLGTVAFAAYAEEGGSE